MRYLTLILTSLVLSNFLFGGESYLSKDKIAKQSYVVPLKLMTNAKTFVKKGETQTIKLEFTAGTGQYWRCHHPNIVFIGTEELPQKGKIVGQTELHIFEFKSDEVGLISLEFDLVGVQNKLLTKVIFPIQVY
jgi:hypothetical protein